MKVVRRVDGSVDREKRALWARRMSAMSISPRPRSGRLVEKKGVKSFSAASEYNLHLSINIADIAFAYIIDYFRNFRIDSPNVASIAVRPYWSGHSGIGQLKR